MPTIQRQLSRDVKTSHNSEVVALTRSSENWHLLALQQSSPRLSNQNRNTHGVVHIATMCNIWSAPCLRPLACRNLMMVFIFFRSRFIAAHQAWIHKTLPNGRYIISWTTGGDESGLLHYTLPHQQVGTGLQVPNRCVQPPNIR